MKSHNPNAKFLYHNVKKRQSKPKDSSIKSSSQINDDSLDNIQKSDSKPKNHKNQEEISEEDLKELRTCISNQFKKTNFIHFSAIKHKSNYGFFQPEFKPHQASETEVQNLNRPQVQQKPHINKRNLLSSHNRSQSCPFIEPLYSHDNASMKEGRINDPGIVFSSIKVENGQKKKISMKYLSKHRNKLMNTTGNTQSKVFNHNYSNSLTQSSNTVIVHNIPNQITASIVPNQNLSSILYKKAEEQEQNKTQKQRSKPEKMQNSSYLKVNEQKKSGISEKTLQKKSMTQVSVKHDFYIKTKIQQRITKYQIKEQQEKLQVDTKATNIKDIVLEKLLLPYGNQIFEQANDTSLHSIKESIVMENRSAH